LQDYLRASLLAAQSEEVARRLLEGDHLEVRSLDGGRRLQEGDWLGLFMPFLIGFFFMIAVFATTGYLMQAVIEEKENRTMEVIMTSVTPGQFMTGKILGIVGIGGTQLLAWITFISAFVLLGSRVFEPLLSGAGLLIFVLVDRVAPGAFARLTTPPRPPAEQAEGFVDPGDLIRRIPEDLSSGSFRKYPDEASVREALSAGEISAYYLIPVEYPATGDIIFVQEDFNPFTILEQGAAIRHVLHFNLLGEDAELTRLVAEPYDLKITVLHPTSERDEDSP
jgi:hypothetical protein